MTMVSLTEMTTLIVRVAEELGLDYYIVEPGYVQVWSDEIETYDVIYDDEKDCFKIYEHEDTSPDYIAFDEKELKETLKSIFSSQSQREG